jgi:pimeloyl-ACP methyl ester carboxylesterase
LDLQKRFEALSRGADQKPWNLLTISLGSMVGLDWVNKDPTRFERLVVMNTSCANLCLPQERLRPQRLAELLRIRALRDDPVRREREILKLTTATRHRLEELSEQWGAWAKEKPLRVTVAAAQLWAALRFLTPRRISVPLLVLAGAQDHFVNPVCSKSIADFYKAPFFVHPFGGHDLFLDDPNWILDRLSDWIST